MYQKATKHTFSNLTRNIYILCIFCLATLYSLKFDLSNFYHQKVFIWDARYVFSIASNWSENLLQIPSDVPNPFNQRVSYPLLYGAIAEWGGVAFHTSAILTDLGAILISGLLLGWYLAKIVKLRDSITLLFVIFFFFSWNFPLRSTIFWPGNGLGFQLITIWVAYFAIKASMNKTNKRAFILLFCALIFAAASRELTSALLIGVLIFKVAIQRINLDRFENSRNLFTDAISKTKLIGFILVTIATHFFVSLISEGEQPDFLETTINYLGNMVARDSVHTLLYSMLIAIGVFLIPIFLVVISATDRLMLKTRIKQSYELQIAIYLIVADLILLLFGGADWPRFIIWMFPFWAHLSISSFKILQQNWKRNKAIAIFALVVIGTLQAQVLIPSNPAIFFPKLGEYCSEGGIKTDYSDQSFRGISLMKRWKNETSLVEEVDQLALREDFSQILGDKWDGPRSEVPAVKTSCISQNRGPYSGAYRFELNNIPFPLGFLHNQHEYWILLPFYGEWRVQMMYFGQWMLIFGAAVAIKRKASMQMENE